MGALILTGDCRTLLPTLESGSVQCCVTSPPYWGLRDYGVRGLIGLEKSPSLWLEEMVQVFREVRRALCKDGTCWINMGDSYATGTSIARKETTIRSAKVPASWSNRCQTTRLHATELKAKDLERMAAELNDLLAVVELLTADGILPGGFVSRELIEAKKAKLARFVVYAREKGALKS